MTRSLVYVPFVVAIAGSAAGAPVQVLGLPLGGQLPRPIPKCTAKEQDPVSGITAERLCRVHGKAKQPLAKGEELRWPGRNTRPHFADVNTVFVNISEKENVLRGFNFETNYRYQDDIRKGVILKFGLPSYAHSDGFAWKWEHNDAVVDLMCIREIDKCTINFAAPADPKAVAAAQVQAAAAEAKRQKGL